MTDYKINNFVSATLNLMHGVLKPKNTFHLVNGVLAEHNVNTSWSRNNAKLALKALKKGILLDSKLVAGYTYDDLNLIVSIAIDQFGLDSNKINATFYKNFTDVEKRSELQLRFDQLLNYATVYGQNEAGNVTYNGKGIGAYIPNRSHKEELEIMNSLVVIKALSCDEIEKSIHDLLNGSALSEGMINSAITIISYLNLKINFASVKNKQVALKLMSSVLNTNPDAFIDYNKLSFEMKTRLLLAMLTDNKETQLLNKSKEQRTNIEVYAENDYDDRTSLNKVFKHLFAGKDKEIYLARHIQRYHVFYILLKHALDKENKHIVTRGFNLSKKVKHAKAPINYANNILSAADPAKVLKQVNNYKLIKIINYLQQKSWDNKHRYFVIRNGKSYVTHGFDDYKNISYAITTNKDLFKDKKAKHILPIAINMLRDRLAKSGKLNSKFILLDNPKQKAVNLALPDSAKKLLGSIPYLTSVTINKPILTTGISWKQEADIDLHAQTLDGENIGWNDDFKDNDNGIVFTGDMTSLNNEGYAAEYMRLDATKLDKPIIFNMDLYAADESNIKADLLVAGSNKQNKYLTRLNPKENFNTKDQNQIFTKIDKNMVSIKNIELTINDRSRNLLIAIPKDNGSWQVIFYGQKFGNSMVLYHDLVHVLLDTLINQVVHAYRINNLFKQTNIDNGNVMIRFATLGDKYNKSASLICYSEDDVNKYRQKFPDTKDWQTVDLRLNHLAPDTLINLLTQK